MDDKAITENFALTNEKINLIKQILEVRIETLETELRTLKLKIGENDGK